MKRLSDCRVLLVDDAQTNLDILVEALKPDHKLSRVGSVKPVQVILSSPLYVKRLKSNIALKSY